MARYIITGSYTAAAVHGMIARPSDRAAATGALVKAGAGTMETYYLTTGDHDFLMVVQADDMQRMLASLLVASASGAVTGLKTVQAFTSDEFLAAQKAAGAIAAAYKAPN
ncbi:GYD domain-containing protein [Rhodobacter sp. Har01]|uniref:GYD domain-containing protein n=1 Tax=Rhodobacter sp. Har01 TaxID=2883999 RepID=UPI001D082304|nr:GYD domain-containing protein [Rhodobacter sp. Har01]MCB6178744.1 GYD domain-containing protein [Rhodobacter sp. Har01]